MKQVIIVNKSLGMSQGKLAAQVAHASVCAFRKANFVEKQEWLHNSYPKIVLQVESMEDLINLKEEADKKDLPTALIIDEGRTEIPGNSVTTLGIGPADSEEINSITGNLRLL